MTCETVEKRHREVAERRGGVVKRIEELQARSQLCETDPEEIERFEAEVVERKQRRKQRQRRVAELEERLRQSEVIPEDIERLEAEVRDREEKLRARTGEAGILVKRVKMLQEEHASLSERVEHTRRLIADLEASPDRRTFLAVQRIWDVAAAPRDGAHVMTILGAVNQTESSIARLNEIGGRLDRVVSGVDRWA